MAPISVTKDLKRKRGEIVEEEVKKAPYKQRVLVLSSRGITQRQRHLMNDLASLLPHSKKGIIRSPPLPCTSGSSGRTPGLTITAFQIYFFFLKINLLDAKLDSKHQLPLLNELCDLSNCNNALFFEARRKHGDLYLWAAKAPNGPSIRFHVLNAHTMDELKMTGNCLKGSRPIVVFDKAFDDSPHLMVIKEVLMNVSLHLLLLSCERASAKH
jgi:ribosome biogenesis protein BRX1